MAIIIRKKLPTIKYYTYVYVFQPHRKICFLDSSGFPTYIHRLITFYKECVKKCTVLPRKMKLTFV